MNSAYEQTLYTSFTSVQVYMTKKNKIKHWMLIVEKWLFASVLLTKAISEATSPPLLWPHTVSTHLALNLLFPLPLIYQHFQSLLPTVINNSIHPNRWEAKLLFFNISYCVTHLGSPLSDSQNISSVSTHSDRAHRYWCPSGPSTNPIGSWCFSSIAHVEPGPSNSTNPFIPNTTV